MGCTKNLWLTFGGQKGNPYRGFCDQIGPAKSIALDIGYSFHFGVGAISWSSKKQKCRRTIQYGGRIRSATHAAKEAICYEVLSVKSKENQKIRSPFCAIIKEQSRSQKTINSTDVRNILTCDIIHSWGCWRWKINVKYVPTDDNVSDIFTNHYPDPNSSTSSTSLDYDPNSMHRMIQHIKEGGCYYSIGVRLCCMGYEQRWWCEKRRKTRSTNNLYDRVSDQRVRDA